LSVKRALFAGLASRMANHPRERQRRREKMG
jgi:hypothetical protein